MGTSNDKQFDEEAVCDTCGKYGAFAVGDRKLCLDCYEAIGSWCPEFGKYDLWRFEDEKQGAKKHLQGPRETLEADAFLT